MAKENAGKKLAPPLQPAEREVRNLLEMFEFFLTERQLGKPIEALGEAVRDLRLIIGRLLADHFMGLSSRQGEKFCTALAAMLADRAEALPAERGDDRRYSDYCIGEILTAFEYAEEIKEAYPRDRIQQKILAQGIPILRPFDYGLRGKLKLVPTRKKKIRYG